MCTISLRKPDFSAPYTPTGTNPAPYIDVTIRGVSNTPRDLEDKSKLEVTQGILDTAASRTLVCQSIIDRIQVQPRGGRLALIGLSTQRTVVNEYLLELELYGKVYELRVGGWQRARNAIRKPYILIGRDILNNDSIMFDGVPMVEDPLNYHVWRNVR